MKWIHVFGTKRCETRRSIKFWINKKGTTGNQWNQHLILKRFCKGISLLEKWISTSDTCSCVIIGLNWKCLLHMIPLSSLHTLSVHCLHPTTMCPRLSGWVSASLYSSLPNQHTAFTLIYSLILLIASAIKGTLYSLVDFSWGFWETELT